MKRKIKKAVSKAKAGIEPYLKKGPLLDTGAQVGGAALGLTTAKITDLRLNTENKAWVPLALLGAGLIGTHVLNVKNSDDRLMKSLKGATAGVAIFGGLRLANLVLTPGSKLFGLNGIMSEDLIAKLRQYIPTISGLGNPGYADDPLLAMMGLEKYGSSNIPDYPIDATSYQSALEGEFQMAEVL